MINKKLIPQDKVFEFLRTEFLTVINEQLENEQITMPIGKFNEDTIFKEQSDYDGTLTVHNLAIEDEDDEFNYGIYKFMGGAILSNNLMNAYTYTYVFETITFEKYRDDLIKVLTAYALKLNGEPVQLEDEDGNTITMFAQVQNFPTTSNKMDINASEKFFSFITIRMTFYEGLIHSTNTTFLLNGTQIPYGEINFERQAIEPIADLKKAHENRYVQSKTSFGVSVNGNYQVNTGTQRITEWLFDETKASEPVRLFYWDGVNVKAGNYLIVDVKMNVNYGTLVNYAMNLVPSQNQTMSKVPLFVIDGIDFSVQGNAIGAKEYPAGTVVQFKPNVIEGKTFVNYTVKKGTVSITQLPQTEIVFQFTMPSTPVVIQMNYE